MKKTINLIMKGMMLGSMSLSLSCASLHATSLPPLQDRTLRLSDKVAGFEYQWEECVKKFLGVCTKKEMKVEYYDLADPQMKQKLIDMGFVAKVKEKVGP